MKRASSGTAAGNRGEERGVSTRERKKRYGQDRRAEIRGTLLHTHTYIHIYMHTSEHTYIHRSVLYTHGQTRRSQEETLSRSTDHGKETRSELEGAARIGEEALVALLLCNAQKPDSAQRIPRPLDAQSASSTIIGDVSRHRSFP